MSTSEAARILRPGGRAIWSHVDFAGIVLNARDTVLNRRILETHATFRPGWMRHVDGYIGRRLAGLVRNSPLLLDHVAVHMSVETAFVGEARWRIDQITEVLRPAARQRRIELTPLDIDRWIDDLESLDATGGFYFAEPTMVVVGRRPAGDPVARPATGSARRVAAV